MKQRRFKEPPILKLVDQSHYGEWTEWLQLEAKVGAWSTDLENGDVWWSDEVYRIYGVQKGAIADSLEKYFGDQGAEKLRKAMTKAIANQQGWNLVLPFHAADGAKKWVRTTGHLAVSGERRVLFGTLQDLTVWYNEIKEQKRRSEHQARLAMLGELSAGVSHEVNNPLAIIMGLVRSMRGRLKKKEIEPSTLLESLDKVDANCWRVKDIVDGLRSLATQNDHDAVCEAHEAADQMIRMIREVYRASDVELRFISNSAPVWLHMSATGLQQILVNLLSNGRDALFDCESKVLEVALEQRGDRVLLAVRDSGTGVTPDTAAKMFDAFFTTKSPKAGTGLGLSIAQSIAHDYNAHISWRNLHPGAEFVLDCEAAESPQVVVPIDGSSGPLALSICADLRVLIIDDELVAEDIAQTLEPLELAVNVCSDIEEALTLCCEHDYDVVMCDQERMVSPDHDLLQELSKSGIDRMPYIVALSDSVTGEIPAGANEALNRSVDYREFELMIRRVSALR